MNKLAVLVDGSSFIYRAYYALPQLTSNGRAIGAIYGFCSMLISLLEKHRSDLFLVALDSGRHTFRSEISSSYKANRQDTPEELVSQFPILREACHAFGIRTAEKKGFEADDILATYADKLSKLDYDVRILSSDKDLMQLVNDRVSLFDPMKSKVIKSAEVVEKYGVTPDKMIPLQALMGDSSDNIAGIPGVGPKTAAKLINEYGTIEEIYRNIDSIKQAKLRSNLLTGREALDTSLKLVTLSKDVEIDEDIENIKINIDMEQAVGFLSKYGLDSLIRRLQKQNAHKEIKKRTSFVINSVQDLRNFFELNRVDKFSFFCASCSNDTAVIALCCENAVGRCSFHMSDNSGDLFNAKGHLTYSDVRDELRQHNCLKISFRNMFKYFYGENLDNYEDIAVMCYILKGAISDKIRDIFPNASDNIGNLSFNDIVDVEQIVAISELIYDDFDSFRKQLKDSNLLDIYEKIDRPLVKIVNEMESNGILLSPNVLETLSSDFSEKLKEIEAKIFDIAGEKFNVGSVKQLASILFDKLGVPAPKKKGLDVDALEDLSQYSELPTLVIEWRKVSKLLSTYTNSLSKLVNSSTGRIHTTFNITSTITGRLSSSNPNLQNIPIKTSFGREIRHAFVSAAGHKLLSFDYSQIELRVLAHVADTKLLKDAFLAGKDVHAITAANVFDIPVENVTSEMRAHAKTVNFGVIYGISPFGLAKMLNISNGSASEYIKRYFEKIPEFDAFRQNTLEFARSNGYVLTAFGRRCYIRDILSRNYQLRQFSERQAVNAVIQGSAADIVKIAMIKVASQMKPLHSKMLLQVHDELIFETEDDFVDAAISSIKETMEHAVSLSVPLEVSHESENYLK